jgi:phosphohistidine phosphatase
LTIFNPVKTLIVIRHAKSSWDDITLGDFNRPLNERGERDAPRMGKRLKEKRIVPDLLISSPATRALTTCRKFADILGYPQSNIKPEDDLYHANEDEILRIIHSINNKHDTVLIFGHNPGVTDFVNKLTNTFINNVPTCGVVSCSIPVEDWSAIEWGKADLNFFDFPKSKDD